MNPVGYLSEIFVSFQGEGLHAGRRQLFIRTAGCNLRCRYCDTPDSLERGPLFRIVERDRVREERNPVSVDRLASHVREVLDSSGPVDGTSLTGGEPLLQADFLARLVSSSPAIPRPVLLETSGVLPDRLAVVLPHVDVVSMDIKIPSNTAEPAYWDAHERFLRLARGKAYVKILVDHETLASEVAAAAGLVASNAPETPLFLQPISNSDGTAASDSDALAHFFETARQQLADVRVLPQTHKMLGVR